MYQVLIEKKVQKQLEKIAEPDYSKIKKAILGLAKNPRPVNCKKLKGRSGYRIRISDYHVIYDVFDEYLVVQILATGHRKDIYE